MIEEFMLVISVTLNHDLFIYSLFYIRNPILLPIVEKVFNSTKFLSVFALIYYTDFRTDTEIKCIYLLLK